MTDTTKKRLDILAWIMVIVGLALAAYGITKLCHFVAVRNATIMHKVHIYGTATGKAPVRVVERS
jgi:hypothetical protein